MAAIPVALLCVGAAMACALLRPGRPEMAMGLALAAGAAALLVTREQLSQAAGLLGWLTEQAALSQGDAGILLKAAGVALVSEFGAELCRDAGESSLAGRIELAARISLLVMAAPYIQRIAALIGELQE